MKQRDRIRMSDEEIWTFLGETKTLIVASLNPDGTPHLTVLWFTIKNRAILFETYGKSQKVLNLRRDPRITVLCEDGREYDVLRGVSIAGRAEIIDEGPELVEAMAELARHNSPKATPEEIARSAQFMAQKRVAIVVHPEKFVSWDHRKIGG